LISPSSWHLPLLPRTFPSRFAGANLDPRPAKSHAGHK
jgi:hypothetical protein